jgi:hypothetical protein
MDDAIAKNVMNVSLLPLMPKKGNEKKSSEHTYAFNVRVHKLEYFL